MRESSGVILAVLALLTGLLAGCSGINKSITEGVLAREKPREWRIEYASRLQYTLTSKTLQDIEFEGSRNAGNVVVRYQRGLGEQAQCIADQAATLLEAVHERTGVVLSTRSTIFLLRFDQTPQAFNITLTAEPGEFQLPLFLDAGQESCEAIIARSRSYPYLLVHEVVETSLADETGGSVLPDLGWGVLGLRMNVNNYTRWFRDGLANYAGYIAYEIVARQMSSEQRFQQRELLLHTEPFSSLAQVGDKLFGWPQSSRKSDEAAYYNAALGLFLLIADAFGEQAIRDIVGEIAQREAVDGRDLIEITNRVIDTDVTQLARDFEFPRLGIEVERMTAALARNKGVEPREGLFLQAVHQGSLAEKVGLQPKDVITAAGDKPITNRLDFELGLFKARKQPAVALTIQRMGTGLLTLELPLKDPPPAAKNTPPGKRRNLLEKGRVEISPLFSSF